MIRTIFFAAALFALAGSAWAQDCPALSVGERAALIDRHVFGGLPTDNPILVRRGYVLSYDEAHRVPRWAAWEEAPDYRQIPDRNVSRWGSFHADPDIADPVQDDDYTGLYASPDNFARGHIVPFYISGGDRDGDGLLAADGDGRELVDIDDACTVFEIMYLSNIAPQYHRRFNGSGGLWYELETDLRGLIDTQGETFHIIAGSIFSDDADVQTVGPGTPPTIGVPNMFYKIVVTDDGPIGFLFAHRRQSDPQACPLDAELADCIVPISAIEAAAGIDVFSELGSLEAEFEAIDGAALWRGLKTP